MDDACDERGEGRTPHHQAHGQTVSRANMAGVFHHSVRNAAECEHKDKEREDLARQETHNLIILAQNGGEAELESH